MSNLLEKASIILTPTAYNDGKVLCVKPSDGTGDFDFSRNSAATRVNAQGLVENVQILSSNLIVNGDFATNSDWIFNTGWSYETNKAVCVPSGGGNGINQNVNGKIFSGKTYKIEYTIQDYVSGNVRPSFSGGGTATGTTNSANGTFTQNLIPTANNTTFSIKATGTSGGFNGSITNVSIIEISQDTNLPRINYESGCGSWLFEPQSTNLVPYSEDFTQWIASGDVTIESGYLSPDGANNAYKISGTNNNIKTTISSLTGTSQRTIFARTVSGTGTAKLFTHRNNTNNLFTITEQWQRFEINSTTVITSQTSFFGIDFRGGSLTEIILWGANATNDQDYPTSYVPSNGSTVTRNQDLCTNGGSAASINSSEGVLYAEIAALANDGTIRFLGLNDGSSNNRVVILYHNSNNNIRAIISSGGTKFVDVNSSVTSSLDFHKVAIKYKLNDFALWIDGVEVATDTSLNAPIGLNSLDFLLSGANNFFGKTKALAVWKEALTDAELTSLTTI